MAQPPFQADAFQIEPGSGQTLTLSRDATTGAMVFKDTLVPSGITLSNLANLSTVTGVLTVGKGGTGAKYTTIQAALNAVPTSSSSTSPYVILVFPGVYTETLSWTKDGVSLIGLGRVVLQPVGATPVVSILAAVASTPLRALLKDLTIIQANDGLACVSLVGGVGSTVGSLGIVLEGCDLQPTGIGGYTVYGDTINSLTLLNCRSDGVPSSASLRTTQCTGVRVLGGSQPLVQVDYNSAGILPSVLHVSISGLLPDWKRPLNFAGGWGTGDP